MFLFIDFCQLGWLPIILSLPLGLLLGWLLWGRIKSELEELREESARYRRKIQEQENVMHISNQRIAEFESLQYTPQEHSNSELELSRKKITQLEAELALSIGKLSESNETEKLGILDENLNVSRSRITALEGDLALAKGKILEFEDGSELELARKRITTLEGELALSLGTNLNERNKNTLEESRRRITELEGQLALAQGDILNFNAKQDLTSSSIAKSKSSKKASKSNKKLAPKADKKRKAKKENVTSRISTTTKSSTKSKAAKSKTKKAKTKPAKYAPLKSDNLQIIEGIGPKMNQILVDNGITDWHVLADKTKKDLENVLGQFGDRYKIIDPSDWPTQAAYASHYDFKGLVAYQKKDGSDSKAEKVFIKLKINKKYRLNDLKAIEGIGPKISELLQKAGIKTWKQLANTPVVKIQDILASAGKRYQLADPTTWPQQAGLAAKGEYDELSDLQSKLSGGRAK